MPERLQDLAQSFARHLRAEGKAERTAMIYGQSVRFYSEWLVAQGREASLDELSRASIREWPAHFTASATAGPSRRLLNDTLAD